MGLRTWLGLKKPSGAIPVSSLAERPSAVDSLPLLEGLIEPNFPIDIVYTWVDGDDPEFQEIRRQYAPPDARPEISGPMRFTSHDELRYSLRSIGNFAPWVNHIYIVTNGQRPKWLAGHPKLTLVTHRDILEPEYLPTFNAKVIESALHRIPGLSEHYIYFNDDMLLLRPLRPTDCFTASGLMFAYLEDIPIPPGPPAKSDTATIWGIKNARDAVLRTRGRCINLRTQHLFYPQLRSIAEACEREFAADYDRFRRNRFRAMDDLQCTGFLHQAVAYLEGRSVCTRASYWYVNIGRPGVELLYEKILAERGTTEARMAVCLNDNTKSRLEDAERLLSSFLERCFPEPSQFEVPLNSSCSSFPQN